MIIMVNEEPVGRVHNLAVHPEDVLGLIFAAWDGAEGIAGAFGTAQSPGVFDKLVVVGWVNDGEFEI